MSQTIENGSLPHTFAPSESMLHVAPPWFQLQTETPKCSSVQNECALAFKNKQPRSELSIVDRVRDGYFLITLLAMLR